MGYNSSSASDRLSAVRDAIAKCLESQEYSLSDRRQRRAELKELRAMERELMAEVARAGGTGLATVVQIDRPT